MRLFIISLLFVFSIGIMKSQTLLFSDDFESYTLDTNLVKASSYPEWQTWSGAVGGSEDPIISDYYALDGLQSVKFTPNNDVVLHLDDKTSGRYIISFDYIVNVNKEGYFNVLNDFSGQNSIWAFQAYFNTDSTGSIDANGVDAATFTFSNGIWNNFNFIIDLDDDFASFFMDNNELISWIFSKGTFGTGTLNKLDAVNFYGVPNSEFYIDNISFYETTAPNAPLNLQGTFANNEVDLNWEAPLDSIPDYYILFANGIDISGQITDTFYIHQNPYPGDYSYFVRAFYSEEGYSPKSNQVDLLVPGGVDRNFVVVEKGTGTWCPYCPGAAMGFDQLHSQGDKVALIAYHYNDSYQTSESLNRIGYYNISSYPTAVFDGGNITPGGHATQSLYPNYKAIYDEKIEKTSLYSLNLDMEMIDATNFEANIDITQHSSYYSGPFKLYSVITESNIMQSWQNQSQLDFVFRKMYPSTTGINLDFSTDSNYSTTIPFEIQSTWVKDNCEFIVFIQNTSTKEILQAALVDMSSLMSIDKNTIQAITIKPNPAKGMVSIYASEIEKINIYNLTGQIVYENEFQLNEAHIDIRDLKPGLYIVKIKTGDGIQSQKLIVQ